MPLVHLLHLLVVVCGVVPVRGAALKLTAPSRWVVGTVHLESIENDPERSMRHLQLCEIMHALEQLRGVPTAATHTTTANTSTSTATTATTTAPSTATSTATSTSPEEASSVVGEAETGSNAEATPLRDVVWMGDMNVLARAEENEMFARESENAVQRCGNGLPPFVDLWYAACCGSCAPEAAVCCCVLPLCVACVVLLTALCAIGASYIRSTRATLRTPTLT